MSSRRPEEVDRLRRMCLLTIDQLTATGAELAAATSPEQVAFFGRDLGAAVEGSASEGELGELFRALDRTCVYATAALNALGKAREAAEQFIQWGHDMEAEDYPDSTPTDPGENPEA